MDCAGNAQPSCPKGAPIVDASGTFKPFAPLERLEVRSGRPGAADWEWGLGRNTQQAGAFVTGQTDWVSGRDYPFTLTYAPDGTGRIVVRDGSKTVVDATYTNSVAPMRSGNALRFAVKTSEGVGAARSIRLTVASINGHAVELSVIESGNFSETALVVASADLLAGFSLSGTIRLVFPGPKPPQGSRMNAFITAGNIDCIGHIGGGPPPVLSNPQPVSGTVLAADALPTVAVTITDGGGGVAPTTARLIIDGNDVTSTATVTASGIVYVPPSPLGEGAHSVTARVQNSAGRESVLSWSFQTRSAPTIPTVTPQDVFTTALRPVIRASFEDIGAGIDAGATRISVDGVDVTPQATVNAQSVMYEPQVDLTAGLHTVVVSVADRAGNITSRTWTFSVLVLPPAPPQPGSLGRIEPPVLVLPTR